MKLIIRSLTFALTFLSLFLVQLRAQPEIIPDKPDGVYSTGETVTWTIRLAGDTIPDSLRYAVKAGGLNVVEQGLLECEEGKAQVDYTFNTPGSVLLEVRWGKDEQFFNKAIGGALADPMQFRLSGTRPEDFDAFWKEKVAELSAVPMNAQLEKRESGVPGVDYYHITMNNIRGTRIRGQLARPAEGESFPALLIVQWAGVYPLEQIWAVSRAQEGWLVLNINPHDLPIQEEAEFYREQARGDLRNYSAIGNDDRETSYFLRMYLSCYRAAEYLSQRPDWNGETLVVTGTSQGGQQALMTAGFHPGITACMALVPAGFDMLGPELGRKGGWPQWYNQTSGKDPDKVHKASRYYDVANFIPRIKCPVLVGVGLLDETCPPEGILAGLNQLKGPKEIMLLPRSRHQNWNGGQDPYNTRFHEVWLPALKTGKKMAGDQ